MNKKKNLPIFISLLIVSLFFTLAFYYVDNNIRINYESIMAKSFNHAELVGDFDQKDLDKIKEIDTVDQVGKISLDPDVGKYKDDLVVLNYQDQDINKMRTYSRLREGRFAKNKDEIVLSESFVKKNNLSIGDKISLDLGKREIDGDAVGPTSVYTDREDFKKKTSKVYKLVGIYPDVYNKYSRLNFALGLKNKMEYFRAYIKFDSFEEAYKNKDEIKKLINKITGKDIKLVFDEGLIAYYGLEDPPLKKFMAKAIIVFSILVCAGIFIFFTRNIFMVWGLRKIRDLSVYKSIGSTDFQVYLALVKEGVFISLIPILLGHFLGFAFIRYLYRYAQESYDKEFIEKIEFNPLLSLIVIVFAFIVVALAIRKPAKKISKINIIDGIRGNIDFSKSKKRRSKSLWKELKLNNLASISSQRYISSIGLIIISVFVIIIGISKYYRDYSYFDSGYNFRVDYYSKDEEIPPVFDKILENIDHDKAYICKEKYVEVKSGLALSKEAKEAFLDREIEKNLKKYKTQYFDGYIIALEEKDLKELGGDKGEFILYNMVQEDSSKAISMGKMIKYFNNPKSFKVKFGNDYKTDLKIAKTISDLGPYKSRTMPFDIKIYTDFGTYKKLMEKSQDKDYRSYPFELNMDIKEDRKKAKGYIENIIRDNISAEERFNLVIEEEMRTNESIEIESFRKIVLGIGLIAFILNLTNGYASINMSLMTRRKEIGSLYSCGMDLDQVKNIYQKEFIIEQIKSFGLAIIVSLGVMVTISIFSPSLTLKNLLSYYDYKVFLAFSLVVYAINLLIYHFSLKRILQKPTIDLLRSI